MSEEKGVKGYIGKKEVLELLATMFGCTAETAELNEIGDEEVRKLTEMCRKCKKSWEGWNYVEIGKWIVREYEKIEEAEKKG